ncbi:hypothetical protein GCM10009712_03040 [Pseudarthrobacter sulfonivorans]
MQPGGQAGLQLWQESGPDQNAVDLVAENELAGIGWQIILQGQDEKGRMAALMHEDFPERGPHKRRHVVKVQCPKSGACGR